MRLNRSAGGLGAFLIALVAGGSVHLSQGQAAERFGKTKVLDGDYALPQPDHLKVFSLGYRSALADLLFGKTMVAAGQHFVNKSVFEHLEGHLRAIVGLEPSYRDVYFYADSLLTLSSIELPKENYRAARELQVEGLALFPDDYQFWISAGQFITYLAPPHLPPTEDPMEWRRAGAQILQHACDIWPSEGQQPISCVGSSRHLTEEGEIEAQIRSLERRIAITDDPEARQQATAKLEGLLGEAARQQFRRRAALLGEQHARDLSLSSRGAYQLIGPPSEVASCAGLRLPPTSITCASSFAVWGELSRSAPEKIQ